MFIADQHLIYLAEANDWEFQSPIEVDNLEQVRSLTINDEMMGIAPTYPQDRVWIYDQDTSETFSLMHHMLEEPVRVLFDEDFISVLCNDSGRVLRFGLSDLFFHDQFGDINGQTALRFAHDMRLGPEGNLHIATESRQFGRLQRWSTNGEYLSSYEELEDNWFPTAISIDKTGQLWAADYLNNRIRIFDVESGMHKL